MRAGGVDPSRVSKKKRSPKPKPKRSQHVPPTPEEPQPLPSDASQASNQPETPTTSEDHYMADNTIATTPVAPGHSVIDITKSFQVFLHCSFMFILTFLYILQGIFMLLSKISHSCDHQGN